MNATRELCLVALSLLAFVLLVSQLPNHATTVRVGGMCMAGDCP